jgi:hypothetical protein
LKADRVHIAPATWKRIVDRTCELSRNLSKDRKEVYSSVDGKIQLSIWKPSGYSLIRETAEGFGFKVEQEELALA